MIVLPPLETLQGKRLHLGVCGSVAAYKAVELLRLLQKAGMDLGVTLTGAACRFIQPLSFSSLGADPVYTDMFRQGDDPFAHLEPGRTAEAFIVAPATAATIARLAQGLADDMLSAQALAFAGPLILAPAMNPRMWDHPATRANIALLRNRGALVVEPGVGLAACGDSGQGRLAELSDIVFAVARALLPQDYADKTVLLTLGPTREAWDDVRVWTNRSTGRMGAALALAAWLRGARVLAVAGPGVPALPSAVERHDVQSARQMLAAAEGLWPQADYGLFCAAVADFSPEPFGGGKFKKSGAEDGFSMHFTANPDILATLSARAAPHQRLLGFAAETENLEDRTRSKLMRKKAHMLAGNRVGVDGSGFASADNIMFVCDRAGREEHWPSMSKDEVAWRLLDWLSTL